MRQDLECYDLIAKLRYAVEIISRELITFQTVGKFSFALLKVGYY